MQIYDKVAGKSNESKPFIEAMTRKSEARSRSIIRFETESEPFSENMMRQTVRAVDNREGVEVVPESGAKAPEYYKVRNRLRVIQRKGSAANLSGDG